jgi:hypothetical protein
MADRCGGLSYTVGTKGGYLVRGFNDLKWLPEVPLADSGAMPFG